MSDKDNTLTDAREEELVQKGIRIPAYLSKAVAHEAIDRGTTEQQLWIDAMHKFLKIPKQSAA